MHGGEQRAGCRIRNSTIFLHECLGFDKLRLCVTTAHTDTFKTLKPVDPEWGQNINSPRLQPGVMVGLDTQPRRG